MSKQLTKHEMNEALKHLTDTMDEQIKGIVLLAKITRAKYLALRLEGFDEKQAIELCKL